MERYTLKKELKFYFNKKIMVFWILMVIIPVVYLFFIYESYIFRDALDVFTLMLEGLLVVVFPILTTAFYLPHFLQELKNRFIVYERIRTPVKNILFIKFCTNFLVTFFAFSFFIFILFLISFYIFPILNFIEYRPDVYSFDEKSVTMDSYNRHTFTQFLEYGNIVYGFIYSIWVGINAAVYSSIGFIAMLLVKNKFIAISIPTIIYYIGSFILGFLNLRQFRFTDAIFPFSSIQQPIWTSFVTLGLLILISLSMLIVIKIKFNELDDLV